MVQINLFIYIYIYTCYFGTFSNLENSVRYYQISNIGFYNQLLNEQKQCIFKHIIYWFTQNFCKEKTLLATREKLYRWPSLLMNIKLCYKRNGVQGWLFCWFFPPEKLDNRKCYTDEYGCYT